MTTRPSVTPPRDWAFPQPEQLRLDNGLTVLLHDMPGQHVLSARLLVPVSLADEPRDGEGMATAMARLLDEGTEHHDAEEFAALLERKGIALGAAVGDGILSVHLDVPRRRLGEALDLVRQAVAEPIFPEHETTRIIKARLAEIEQERATAPYRAAREFIATYFAPDDRASRPTAGSADTVATITPGALREFHRRHVGPDGASLVIAGHLGGVDVGAVVEEQLGAWGSPEHVLASPMVEGRRDADAARIVLVDRPGSVQSEFAIGCRGVDRNVAGGWAPYPVIAFVLGGSPTARIDAVLREEKGYTYGIRSGFRPRRAGGLFLTTGSVRTEVTSESLTLLLDILDAARDGFTDDEVRSGADYITRTAPGRFTTADAVADETAGLVLDDLPLDFTTTNLVATRTLTADDVSRAYRDVVDGKWTVVIVGDASAYEEEVRALGRGTVTVVPA